MDPDVIVCCLRLNAHDAYECYVRTMGAVMGLWLWWSCLLLLFSLWWCLGFCGAWGFVVFGVVVVVVVMEVTAVRIKINVIVVMTTIIIIIVVVVIIMVITDATSITISAPPLPPTSWR